MSKPSKTRGGSTVQTMLVELPKVMTAAEWNDTYYDACIHLGPGVGFLMAGQIFSGDVLYNGVRYTVSAWGLPGEKVRVTATPHP